MKRGLREVLSWFVPSLAPGHGYDAHMTQRAAAYAAGVWFLFFGGALASLLRLLPPLPSADRATVATALDRMVDLATKDVVRGSFSQFHVAASVALVVCVAVGLEILATTRRTHDQFIVAMGTLASPYTPADVRSGKASGARQMLAGAAGVLLAMAVLLAAHLGRADFSSEGVASSVLAAALYTLLAFGLALWVRGCLLRQRFDLFRYNFSTLRMTSAFQLEKEADGSARSRLEREKRVKDAGWALGTFCVIAGVGATVACGAFSGSVPLLLAPVGVVWAAIAAIHALCLRRARAIAATQGTVDRPWDGSAL